MRIVEIRSNPDLNPKVSVLDMLRPYRDREDAFVSFTKIEKLGINPNSAFSTPVGIYCYPLKEMWSMYVEDREHTIAHDSDGIGKLVPFAGQQPFVTLFSCPPQEGLINDIGDVTHADLDAAVEKLVPIYSDWVDRTMPNYRQTMQKHSDESMDEMSRKAITGIIKDGMTSHGANNKTPGGLLWYLTWKLSNSMSGIERDRGLARNTDNRVAFIWNALMRRIGIIGICDRNGKGVIHVHEPMQAVFFSLKGLRVIARFNNKHVSDQRSDFHRRTGLNAMERKRKERAILDFVERKFFGRGIDLPKDSDIVIK
ncbi:MAG: hypothetical protein EOO77_41675, partial [Oxalobacteraceae bacterium]